MVDAVARADAIIDGKEFLSSEQVAALEKVTPAVVAQAVTRGQLCPGRLGSYSVFTRRDVLRWHKARLASERDVAITRELVRGRDPIDIYLQADGRYSLDQVAKVMLKWAKLTGLWVIEGPRGSYARWLQRLGLVEVTPRMLRRLVELLLADSYVQNLVTERMRIWRALEAQALADGRAGVDPATTPPAD